MSKHNYSQYSNKKNNTPAGDRPESIEKRTLAPIDLDNMLDVPATKVIPEPIIKTVETVELPKSVKGVVANCAKLNVRAYPSRDADVVCVLDVTSEVEVFTEKSTYDWLYVCTVTGVEGYCMRKFIDANL